MPSGDIRDWIYDMLSRQDEKISRLLQVTSEHRMALKILGIALGIVGTAVVGVIVAEIAK